MLVLAVMMLMYAESRVIADESRLGGPKYDAMLTLDVVDEGEFAYQLTAPSTIEGLPYILAALTYAEAIVDDGYERQGPLVEMEEMGGVVVGKFTIPEAHREPRVWAVVYYGELGVDQPSLVAYIMVIDWPGE